MKTLKGEGPRYPAIAIVGEFPVDTDIIEQTPFASKGGWHLKNWLSAMNIDFESCYRTYLFKSTPPGNDLRTLCMTKKDAVEAAKAAFGPKAKYNLPMFATPNKYMDPVAGNQVIQDLKAELDFVQPNLILALGRASCWALLGTHKQDDSRGRISLSTLIPDRKVIATYGPIQVLRSYDLLPTMLADFAKAARESKYPEIRYPQRELWISPSLADCWDFYHRYIQPSTEVLSIDIESEREQVTCIGFAPDKSRALCVPFWDKSKPGWSYWSSPEEEFAAWMFVKHVVQEKRPQLFQNGMYDLQFVLRTQKISMKYPAEDSMLLHHALQPEMEKGLGFLASLHTDSPSWKGLYREARAKETMKADD